MVSINQSISQFIVNDLFDPVHLTSIPRVSLKTDCPPFLTGHHSADKTQPGRNSCPEFAFLAFSLDSIMSLSR